MITFWPHWLRPWWLLLLPLLGWLLWQLWHRQKRAGRWQMILPVAFHAVLLGGGSGRDSKLPWVALGLAWTLAVLALLGPSWQHVEQSSQKPADPLVVLLELTPEMLATDTPPTRLEQARRKLLDLLQSRSDSQTAIIVYAGSAHTLVPLSDDLTTSRNLLDALKPSIMPEAGHRADLAVTNALALLKQSAQGQGRLLLIGSSLGEQERQGIREALSRQSTPLLILGVGTADGAPVMQEKGGFLRDPQGAILLPRLDSPSLKDFASQIDGRYRQASLDDSDLRGLGLFDSPQSLRSDGQTVHLDSWDDQGPWLLLPLLLLAACAGRRGWLLCLPLLFMLPQPSYAFEFNDLWLRPDQQGQRLLEQGRPAEAAQHFKDSQWQGLALYQAGDYASAAQRFAEGNNAADHYNRGNALARAGELEAALDAYEQALERQPDLQPALKNKALVERLLEQDKQQQASNPNKPDGSKKDDIGESPQAGAATAPQNPNQPLPPSGDDSSANNNTVTSNPNSPAGGNDVPGSQLGDENTTRPPIKPADTALDGERRQALEQWLRQIPDDPGELLRRKFWYEQQQRQEQTR
ncbi:VWA domain-containing protein [Pseudomonas sp. MH9.2]|uniref:vWA domain-containing protein n=1 Tax=unclassified Pseudomonas TaxID=196821 RepID=UPI002AC8B1BA|nr:MULTISPECIES: VWA domain-containing protein [unclassified Pseudomonas]MEB0006918.1 VWA domain-containing protein [Pseudomonas sp. RTB2]MEB0015714.1 VWA domain-containing protein [Pseudomonas sp. RTB3]MEB0025725.1 VWA domain-containing protein [Pseudomonas sp. MH9.2]MEB0269920.1 VWA domain-containing protein [Pseudomonas sp. 5B4]WPX68320.1 VWA domain-containing protein [Pseudomonas sp. MH9.2]